MEKGFSGGPVVHGNLVVAINVTANVWNLKWAIWPNILLLTASTLSMVVLGNQGIPWTPYIENPFWGVGLDYVTKLNRPLLNQSVIIGWNAISVLLDLYRYVSTVDCEGLLDSRQITQSILDWMKGQVTSDQRDKS